MSESEQAVPTCCNGDENGTCCPGPETTDPTAGERLRIARLVEQDMAEGALLAWRSATARHGLSDHDSLQVYADALTRWSERLRMAFDGNDWRGDQR